ncbi:IS4 family transposase [Phenylobacterium ferrooxidans]|uniref:IS4 family transposase n=1 Tax=Phenylobacterium ferrooxidans TaxID=2982689 RepID=A0ABW6CMS8_9CAUL
MAVRDGDAVDRSAHWSDREVDQGAFKDARLGRRFADILKQLGDGMGGTIPFACQDWANTKAAYRFFSNAKVEEGDILSGHFAATRTRYDACEGPILLLQDTTEFTYQRRHPRDIGFTKSVNSGRDKFRGTAALKRKINPTRVPIEQKESVRWLENLRQSIDRLGRPDRCIHVGDRESDIFELYCLAKELGTHFVVRTCVDRLAGDGSHTISAEMSDVDAAGQHIIEVRDDAGEVVKVALDVRFKQIRVLPPIGKQKRYPSLDLTVIHAVEANAPKGRKRIEWKLLTDLPVESCAEAVEKIRWYAMRWKIEVFHKILKSGCRAEDAKLRTADRLANLVSVFCIISWRVLWLTMLARTSPEAPPTVALTDTEIVLLDRLVSDAGNRKTPPGTLIFYLTKLARLGGYLASAADPPPGNTVVWRGLTRLTDIKLGAEIAGVQNVGN